MSAGKYHTLLLLVAVLVISVAAGGRAYASATLPEPVLRILEGHDLAAADISIYVREVDSGRTLVSHNADTARNPASVLKLLTTFVALEELGPGYTWQTSVYTDGELRDGVLHGDLILKGGGDPYLVHERFWLLLRELRRSGLESIEGNLMLDESLFETTPEDRAAFDNQPYRAYNVTPHALLVNFNVVRFWFEADDEGVAISMEPRPANLRVENRLRPAAGRCRGYQRGITVSARPAERSVRFSGAFPSACTGYTLARSVLEHEDYVFGLFQSLWSELGGKLSGRLMLSETPESADLLVRMESLPLGEVIRSVNKYSNNVMTRQLLYTLGAERYGPPATEQKGIDAIEAWLEQNELKIPELVLENGAGRSRDARINAKHLAEILALAWRSRYMPEFVASLSISGVDGTFGRRGRGSDIRGQAHVKTGSLDHVSTLAGYFQTRTDRRLIVVVLQNARNVHRGPGEEAQQALLQWLNQVSFSRDEAVVD